jgi:hypothetical protein
MELSPAVRGYLIRGAKVASVQFIHKAAGTARWPREGNGRSRSHTRSDQLLAPYAFDREVGYLLPTFS